MRKVIFFLSFFSLLACATRNKDNRSSPNLAAEPTAPTDANQSKAVSSINPLLVPPVTSSENFKLGTLQFAHISTAPNGTEQYFTYQLDNKTNANAAEQGLILWGGKLFPTLVKGEYTINVASCVGTDLADATAHKQCSEQARLDFIEPGNPHDTLEAMVKDIFAITIAIKAKGKKLYQAYIDYRDKTYKHLPSSEFDQNVQNQILYGPDVLAAMLNSSQFPELYKKFYGKEIASPDATANQDPGTQAEIEALTKQISDLSEKQAKDKTQGSYSAGSLLISLGVPAVLLGVIVIGISWHAPKLSGIANSKIDGIQKTVDQSFEVLRKTLYGPLGYTVAVDKDFLFRKYPDLAKAIPHRIDLNSYTLEHNGRVFLIEELPDAPLAADTPADAPKPPKKTMVYELGSGLVKSPTVTSANTTLSPAEFDALSPQLKTDFELKNGKYELRADVFAKKYVAIGGVVYRKTLPMNEHLFPKLSRTTLDNLLLAKTLMDMRDPLQANANYGKGIPLFDEQGRLVEPPEAWKVEGKNWLSEKGSIDRLDMAALGREHPQLSFPDDFQFTRADLKNPAKVVVLSDKVSGLGKVGPGIRALPMGMGTGIADAIGEPAWKIEMGLGMKQYDVEHKLAQMKKKVPTEQIEKFSKFGKIVGGGLVIGGAAAIAGSFVQEYALAGDSAKDNLNTKLKIVEDELATLHKQRSDISEKINAWLKANKYPLPDPEWAYQL